MFSGCSPDILSNSIFDGNVVFDDPKEFDDPKVSDGLKVTSNESVDLNDPKEFSMIPIYLMISSTPRDHGIPLDH